ncbi:MAG TPA: hypothetical protein VJ300_06770 [Thermoplasmata archaeon]|nr:hypothetical protein [Thermoplasmata archaeon]
MPILADLGTAALIAIVVFLGALGFLVVFTDATSKARTTAFLIGVGAVAGFSGALGEVGVALVLVGVAAAVLANAVFEWLTMR